MKISDKKAVFLELELFDAKGETLEKTTAKEPFTYLHGLGNIPPAVEEKLEGQEVGFSSEVSLTAEEGFGIYDDALVISLPKEQLSDLPSIEPGVEIIMEPMTEEGEADGEAQVFEIVKLNGDDVVLDGNHPLAGVDTKWTFKVTEVRDATEVELEHGHVHDADSECEA